METQILQKSDWPPLLGEIPDPPKKLFIRGILPAPETKYLCVVGSRRFSPYGKDVCERLIAGLTGYPIAIVSGLALGIDAIAHRGAMRSGLPTLAVPGSGLDERVLYPRAHVGLSREIVAEGGALLSEYESDFKATDWSFPQRNRIMAGISHATLIIEAGEKSGTLITARLAMEYNRDVLVVPGPLFSPFCAGSNTLLRQGATAVTSAENILDALHIAVAEKNASQECAHLGEEERVLLSALDEPRSRDEIVRATGLSPSRASILLTKLELDGFVVERLGKIEKC